MAIDPRGSVRTPAIPARPCAPGIPVSRGRQPVRFALTATAIDPERLKADLEHPAAGAMATFEGWVRNHADGRSVRRLEYQVYPELAQAEGERVVAEALARFDVIAAHCTHRSGILHVGDVAVWVGVAAAHRGAAFDACRYVIDEIKQRLPIWKRETYAEGDSGWVNCQVGGAQRTPSGGTDGTE